MSHSGRDEPGASAARQVLQGFRSKTLPCLLAVLLDRTEQFHPRGVYHHLARSQFCEGDIVYSPPQERSKLPGVAVVFKVHRGDTLFDREKAEKTLVVMDAKAPVAAAYQRANST